MRVCCGGTALPATVTSPVDDRATIGDGTLGGAAGCGGSSGDRTTTGCGGSAGETARWTAATHRLGPDLASNATIWSHGCFDEDAKWDDGRSLGALTGRFGTVG